MTVEFKWYKRETTSNIVSPFLLLKKKTRALFTGFEMALG